MMKNKPGEVKQCLYALNTKSVYALCKHFLRLFNFVFQTEILSLTTKESIQRKVALGDFSTALSSGRRAVIKLGRSDLRQESLLILFPFASSLKSPKGTQKFFSNPI